MSHIQGLQIYKGGNKSKHIYCVIKMARNFIILILYLSFRAS